MASNLNVFDPGETYCTFLLYAKPSTEQTYDLYVGPGFNPCTDARSRREPTSAGRPLSSQRISGLRPAASSTTRAQAFSP